MTGEEKREAFLQKLTALEGLRLPTYTELPSIELYMDQVLGYLNPILENVCRSEDGAPLTPNMINNYVKGGYLARPVQKKYGRDHLAMLYMLCSVKQNLTLPEASALLGEREIEPFFAAFAKIQTAAVQTTATEVKATGGTADALRQKALELALRASAERRMAEEILSALLPDPPDGDEKQKAKAEKKEKKEKEKKEKKAKEKAAKEERAKSEPKSK